MTEKIELSCPSIDEILRSLSEAETYLRLGRKNCADGGTVDAIERAEYHLDGIAIKLEKIRHINAQLRDSRDHFAERVNELEDSEGRAIKALKSCYSKMCRAGIRSAQAEQILSEASAGAGEES